MWDYDGREVAARVAKSRSGSKVRYAVVGLGHIAQVARVMAKQYTDEVGPWRAYLPVLTRTGSTTPVSDGASSKA